MRSLLPYAVAGLGLASMLAAQNTATFPSYAANVEGNASNPYSPLSYGVVRFQSIFDKAELTIPNNALIKSIGYRQDCTYRQPSPAGFKLQIEVRLGRTPKGDDVSTVFANNYSPTAPPTTVFPKGFYDQIGRAHV